MRLSISPDRAVTVPQPDSEPIIFNNEYGAVDQFKDVAGMLPKPKEGGPATHLVAIAARNANCKSIPSEELAEIVKDMAAVDFHLRFFPEAPVIYRLHCEDVTAITPSVPGSGIRQEGDEPSFTDKTVIDTSKQFMIEGGSQAFGERNPSIVQDSPLMMHKPLSFLASGTTEKVQHFINNKPAWKRTPNSKVIVGTGAVDAFLVAQAEAELSTEFGEIDHRAVMTSWAMLASAGLKRLGYRSPIGQHGDIAHRASIEGVAEVVASGLGSQTHIGQRYVGDEEMFIRRIAGVDFDIRADAQTIGNKATERIYAGGGVANRFQGLLYGDRDRTQEYLTRVAGDFISHAGEVDFPAE